MFRLSNSPFWKTGFPPRWERSQCKLHHERLNNKIPLEVPEYCCNSLLMRPAFSQRVAEDWSMERRIAFQFSIPTLRKTLAT
jgi:hypothetical protein